MCVLKLSTKVTQDPVVLSYIQFLFCLQETETKRFGRLRDIQLVLCWSVGMCLAQQHISYDPKTVWCGQNERCIGYSLVQMSPYTTTVDVKQSRWDQVPTFSFNSEFCCFFPDWNVSRWWLSNNSFGNDNCSRKAFSIDKQICRAFPLPLVRWQQGLLLGTEKPNSNLVWRTILLIGFSDCQVVGMITTVECLVLCLRKLSPCGIFGETP